MIVLLLKEGSFQFAATMKDQIAAGNKNNSRQITAGVLRRLRPLLTGVNNIGSCNIFGKFSTS